MSCPFLSRKSLRSLNYIYALYRNPIYQNCDFDSSGAVKEHFKETICVAIVGFNDNAQQFLDTLLQVGQMPNRRLDVTVYAKHVENEKEAYLAARPALASFFDVDCAASGDAYGRISFRAFWETYDRAAHAELSGMDYVLFAEDENESDLDQIRACLKASPFDFKPVIIRAKLPANQQDIMEKPDFAELERIAFNSHLVWTQSLEVDMDDTENKFKEEYNYISSLTFALSIKYKLHSVGIELDGNGAKQAAETFMKLVNRFDANDKDAIKIIADLAAAEHRRWCAEKICDGWQGIALDNITANEKQNKGKTNDSYYRHHYCIAKSGPDNPLAAWTGDDWDRKPIDELDDLDKVSVVTHRKLLAAAEKSKTIILLPLNDLDKSIQEMPEYQDWSACINLIIDSNAKKTCQPYFNAYNRLLHALEDPAAKEIVEKTHADFQFILKSREYDNQKQKDYDLIQQIPFILTFKKDLKLASEFLYGNNSRLYANVSLLKKMNPAEIVFFCEYSKPLDNDLAHFFACIKDYSWLRTKIRFVFGYDPASKEGQKVGDLLTKNNQAVGSIKKPYDAYFSYIAGTDENSLVRKENVDAVVYFSEALGYQLRKSGIPCGRYFYKDGVFDKQSDIMLRAVNFNLAMTIQDILRINGAEGCKQYVPIRLEPAYGVYSASRDDWKKMCKIIKEFLQNHPGASEVDSSGIKPAIITKLKDLHMLSDGERTHSLRFDDADVREMLSQEGKILEIHIYNLCVASGLFDDIATGYKIEWENGRVKNEFDVLLVKGLKSAFIEVKATSDYMENGTLQFGLKQEFYEKLESLNRKFGINSFGFLINDSISRESGDYSNGNLIQVSRGEQFGIRTILPHEIVDAEKIISNWMDHPGN